MVKGSHVGLHVLVVLLQVERAVFNGIPVEMYPRVTFSPEWAPVLEDVKVGVCDCVCVCVCVCVWTQHLVLDVPLLLGGGM